MHRPGRMPLFVRKIPCIARAGRHCLRTDIPCIVCVGAMPCIARELSTGQLDRRYTATLLPKGTTAAGLESEALKLDC
jgi:hypothetical protein